MTGSRPSRRRGGDGPEPSSEGSERRPLLVTEDTDLLDDLLRLCAAAGAKPEVAHGPRATERWRTAPLVVVGVDRARALPVPERRAGVVLVTRDADDAGVWQVAVAVGAERVLVLPDGENWLVERIADAAEGTGPEAMTVGVVGGRGGAGASTLACALAVTAARRGLRTLLVDADPLGGGLDVMLGGEREKGLRWPAFAESRGRVGGGALAESLPELHALRVLSWDRGDSVAIPPPAMRAVMSAARRRGGVVLVDLPRRVDETVAEALAQTDVGLLLVPPELRALAAAGRVAAGLRMVLKDLRVLSCRSAGGGRPASSLPDAEAARLLGLPLAGRVPWESGLVDATTRGAPPGSAPRGPLARFCDGFWDHLQPSAVGSLGEGGAR
ncbi:septum site-determining protein Ssd [Streptomyces sp. NPDC059740]|uniref:septum site-determining protein Ssd n=1 Tax=Streptomyces sp. NPDC059740 TaxID=3346926 RepID=UPI003659B636